MVTMRNPIEKLDEAATRTELGQPYPVTKLTAVISLAGESEARCAHYLHHLLDDARELFQRFPAGGPPAVEAEVMEAARQLHDRIEGLHPGWKRVWIHATRRRLEDADLLLAEWALWWLGRSRSRLNGYAAYEVSRLFVTSYASKRFHVPHAGARRWREIHHYWAQ